MTVEDNPRRDRDDEIADDAPEFDKESGRIIHRDEPPEFERRIGNEPADRPPDFDRDRG